MKIVLLSAASSIHTVRWANGLSGAGHKVHVISQHPLEDPFDPAVEVHILQFRGALGYFTIVPAVRKLMKEIHPDIVNAHYASGYGTTARLVGYRPWVLSVWGSDVYDFPHKSFVHKWLVKKNLLGADAIASTSRCMAEETRSLAPKLGDIDITPFGVTMDAFQSNATESAIHKTPLVIGTVKAMKPVYGIDILIQAYALLVNRLKSYERGDAPDLELRLVGGGDQTGDLKNLADTLGVSDSVKFVGRVPHKKVPDELAKLDIFVALSRSESFGVAAIEASAAGRPIVVSDAGGLSEVTVVGETGFVVPRENPEAAAAALEQLVLDPELRYRMGIAGQSHVAQNYSWTACIQTMLGVYEKTIDQYQHGTNV